MSAAKSCLWIIYHTVDRGDVGERGLAEFTSCQDVTGPVDVFFRGPAAFRRLPQCKSPRSGPAVTLRVSLCLADALAPFNLVRR